MGVIKVVVQTLGVARHCLMIGLLFPALALAASEPPQFQLGYEELLPKFVPWQIPDDEILNLGVDPFRQYELTASAPHWAVPATNLPPQIALHASNNCLAIGWHEGRLYLAWRTAPSHFASKQTHLYLVSSADFGKTWRHERTIYLGTDMREPYFLEFKGRLTFMFFQAGTSPTAFQPKYMWRTVLQPDGHWGPLRTWGNPGEISWEMKVRNGRAWRSSYEGSHYSGTSGVDVFFSVSDDGLNWSPVDPAHPSVYHGGVSEVAYDFDLGGNLWAVTRDEDGDASGFGSHVATAGSSDLGTWNFPTHARPDRFDSPRMFRHGKDLYLVARRDLKGPFDKGWAFLPQSIRKYLLWEKYSLRPKRTALYKINQQTRAVDWIMDLPSAGDTSFPSILRLDPDTYLLANYTSPPKYRKRTWLWGQISPQGTQIYFMTLRFSPRQ